MGDRLWVRETWTDNSHGVPLGYYLHKADLPIHWDAKDTEHGDDVTLEAKDIKWYPSIHMPRAASRLTLEITDIRVERVQDITYIEAKNEGVNYEKGYTNPRNTFMNLWNSIYKNWGDNPWVWVVEFKAV
ncbi:hypothetical protein KAR91_66490 [Candidatus Pacearchaeota archaeon]|nr:hypothetical protein [Candidatus Pacearchaeota archaeon]